MDTLTDLTPAEWRILATLDNGGNSMVGLLLLETQRAAPRHLANLLDASLITLPLGAGTMPQDMRSAYAEIIRGKGIADTDRFKLTRSGLRGLRDPACELRRSIGRYGRPTVAQVCRAVKGASFHFIAERQQVGDLDVWLTGDPIDFSYRVSHSPQFTKVLQVTLTDQGRACVPMGDFR